jgi:hypothetical protein
MHRYRDNKGRFVSSKDSKTTPPTNPTNIGAGKIPPGENSRGASEAPEEEPKTEESTLGQAERKSAEHLGDTKIQFLNPLSVEWQKKKEMQPQRLKLLGSQSWIFPETSA